MGVQREKGEKVLSIMPGREGRRHQHRRFSVTERGNAVNPNAKKKKDREAGPSDAGRKAGRHGKGKDLTHQQRKERARLSVVIPGKKVESPGT